MALVLSLAGAAGALCRLVVDGAVRSRWGPQFPYATLLINVSGSVLLGVLTGLVLFHSAPDQLRTVLGTGFCGGYTTFSTVSFETARLVQERRAAAALLNSAGTLLLSLLGAAGGLALTSL